MTARQTTHALGCGSPGGQASLADDAAESVICTEGHNTEGRQWVFSGSIDSAMPRRVSIIIHSLAVAIISVIAWRYHDPALVLAYVSGVIIEWDLTT